MIIIIRSLPQEKKEAREAQIKKEAKEAHQKKKKKENYIYTKREKREGTMLLSFYHTCASK